MIVVIGAFLFAAAVALVLALCARAESCALADEPWLDWDGFAPHELTEKRRETRLHDVYMRTADGWADHPDPAAVERAKREQRA